MEEVQILRALERAIREPRATKLLSTLADETEALLAKDPRTRLAWRAVPLAAYEGLPDSIASSWVFALRSDCTSGAERHPNSIQRFMSYRGSADMQTWNGKEWVSHRLASGPSASLDERWLSIPLNVWHKPVMGDATWVVVSFHTASDDALIEERPADDAHPDEGRPTSQLYDGRAAR